MSAGALWVLAGVVALGVAFVVFAMWRHPEVRRLALRFSRRRPLETALAMVGALLGTAIITGSLIVGDSLRSSVRAGAFTQLGPIDETVTARDADALSALRDALAGVEEEAPVDGVLFGLRTRGTLTTGAVDADSGVVTVEPDVLLMQLDFAEAQSFGGDPDSTGLVDASTPGEGEVALSEDLAAALGVEQGERVVVHAYGQQPELTVAAILPKVGVAGYSADFGSASLTAFLPLDMIEDLSEQASGRSVVPPTSLAFISNDGGVLGGVERTDEILPVIRGRIEGLEQANVAATKRQLLDTADAIAEQLTEVFLGIGAFAVLAGVLLLVNVFVMLAQERRGQLGIMRAIGMHRTRVVELFFAEGALIAGVASALGALAGIGVGAAIMQLAKSVSGGPAGIAIDVRFAATWSSIAGGFLIGLVISLVTVLGTSLRISQLNIVRAIRGIQPGGDGGGRPWVRLAVGVIGVVMGGAMTVAAVLGSGGGGAGGLLGPAIAAGGLYMFASRPLPSRVVGSLLSLLVLGWALLTPTILPGAFQSADVGIFVLQGLVATGAAVFLLALNQDVVGRGTRALVGLTANVTARLGLAYPLAQPFRTTMTLAMYALVVFTLVLVSLLAAVFGGQVGAYTEAESGGFDLLVQGRLTATLDLDDVVSREGVQAVAPMRHVGFNSEFRGPDAEEFKTWFATGFDGALLELEPPSLDRWTSTFASESEVWRSVLEDPSMMIVGSRFLQEGGNAQAVALGDEVEVRSPFSGQTAARTVVAILEGGFAFNGAMMSSDSLGAIFGPFVPTNRMYVAVEPSADPAAVAADLERAYLDSGVEARTFEEIVSEQQSSQPQFFRILQGYLVLGLLVGTAGLGVVMVRAVRERTRQIGVLRSLGLQPGTVSRALMLEAAFITLQGTIVGALLAGVTAYQLVQNAAVFGGRNVAFTIPWVEVALLLAITLAASVAAAGWPAHRASKIRPATALRFEA